MSWVVTSVTVLYELQLKDSTSQYVSIKAFVSGTVYGLFSSVQQELTSKHKMHKSLKDTAQHITVGLHLNTV